jgi:hypothetical protein
LSANCQPGCPLSIHLSSLPWLVVASSFVMPHPPPPVVFTMRCLILSSSCRSSSTYHCFKVPQAFKMPPPLVRWCLRLIVTTPLVALLPLLVLSTIHHLLSANASPPVGLLFASWLSCHPCCCAAAASRLFSMLPPPLIIHTGWLLHLILSRCFRLPSSHQHRRLLMRWLLTSHPVCLSFTPIG